MSKEILLDVKQVLEQLGIDQSKWIAYEEQNSSEALTPSKSMSP